jgi:hypothetical protein
VTAAVADGRRLEVRTAKFLNPVRPGDVVTISWGEQSGERISFECRVGDPARTAVVGTISCPPPAP